MSYINAMWVWIPRYKYKIPSHIGSATNISTPPQIDIEFEKETSTTGVSETVYRNGITDNGENSNYYTHPAFTFGSEELTGFWVGKFETGGTSDSPYILPTINPIVNLNVKDQFLTSLKFTGGTMNNSTGVVTFSGNDTYGLTGNVNSHSMKNTEWGAVAYLALSQYGKSGNDTYTGEDKEVYINNLQYTGLSGGSPNASINAQHYSYNDITCSTTSCDGSKVLNKGRGASTTGTICGVYDMSGGVWENTMANYNQQTSFSGFTVFPETKYYDLYIGSNNNDVTKDKAILGDATWETIHWYSDISYLVNSNSAWLLRGGYNDYDKLAGVSCAYVSTGQAHESIGFRTVLTL